MSESRGSQPGFYWHDYETWGTRPAHDWPVQFAGLRTDLEGKPQGRPLNIFCKPALDTLPHMEACLITGITPQHAESEGVAERDFFAAIHAEMSAPATCVLGYNSIRFDDEFTRFGFYRNFIDPYEREYRYGNSRWDLIDVVRSCYALRPDALAWPRREDGEVSFRLELLSKSNKLVHEDAHDALSDVRATLALAMLLREREPGLFNHLFSLRDKRKAEAALKLGSGQPRLHISARFPASHACASLVLPLARHPTNRNEIICVDLRYSPRNVLELPAEKLAEYLYTPAADLPAGVERIPLKSVHLNRSPVILSTGLLDDNVRERCAIDPAQMEQHRQLLLAAQGLDKKLQQMAGIQRFDDSGMDAEARLYGGFIPDRDKETLSAIARLDGAELAKRRFAFQDTRLPELLFRYRARNFPESLTAAEQDEWLEYCREKLLQGEQPLLAELEKIERALADKPGKSAGELLVSLRQYLLQKKSLLA